MARLKLNSRTAGSLSMGAAFAMLLSLAGLGWGFGAAGAQPANKTSKHAGAKLELGVNPDGRSRAFLFLFSPPHMSPNSLAETLKQSLGCSEIELKSAHEGQGTWSLDTRCAGALRRHGLKLEGDLHLLPLLHRLRSIGVKDLDVDIYLGVDVPFRCRGLTQYERAPGLPSARFYRVPTAAGLAPGLRLEFGYGASDLARMAFLLLLLLILPVALTLVMRRAVLSKPDARSSGAWFGYRRFLQWNMLGSFVVWIAVVEMLKADSLVQFVLTAHGFDAGGSNLEILASSMLTFLPPILINVFCTVLSYRVFVEVQGAEWTRAEVWQQAVLSQMATLVPIIVVLVGLEEMTIASPALGALSILAGFFLAVLSSRRLRRVMKSEPHALTTGELRDRAFALAGKAGVKLKQLYVLPTRKARMANAFARRGNSILLSDYLLEHLSKRQVDTILGHELGHLKRRHPVLLMIILVGAMIGAAVLAAASDSWVRSLPEGTMMPLAIFAGLAVFYLLARHFERRADAAAVELTGDPEAYIQALAKLTALNRLPIHWGKVQGKLLTHPSTLQRVRAVARQAGISEANLRRILVSPQEPLDRYLVPETSAPEGKAFSTTFKSNLGFRVAWSLIAVSTLAPALIAWIAARVRLPAPLWSELALGLLITLLLASWVTNVGPMWDGLLLKKRLLERMKRQGLDPEAWGGVFVGFSPDACPRLYETSFNWDVGFLACVGDRLCYWGEEARFALLRGQVSGIGLGPGPVSWWPTRRVYVKWHDEAKGTSGTLSFGTADSRSLKKLFGETASLAEKLQAWHRASSWPARLPPELASLESPAFGVVTSVSPRQFGTVRSYLNSALLVSLVALLVGMLFGLGATPDGWGILYTISVAVVVGSAVRLPYSLRRGRFG